jgi:hypothetical protein
MVGCTETLWKRRERSQRLPIGMYISIVHK